MNEKLKFPGANEKIHEIGALAYFVSGQTTGGDRVITEAMIIGRDYLLKDGAVELYGYILSDNDKSYSPGEFVFASLGEAVAAVPEVKKLYEPRLGEEKGDLAGIVGGLKELEGK